MLKSIFMERAEGPANECGVFECTSFKDAHAKIKLWARTSPDTGGYDKTDVRITLSGVEPNEDTSFGFRFDMKRDHAVAYRPLLREAQELALFYGGLWRPAHMTAERYARYLDNAIPPARRELYIKIHAELIELSKLDRGGVL
jgi:hypothetical protein